jgi:hypothetical protein
MGTDSSILSLLRPPRHLSATLPRPPAQLARNSPPDPHGPLPSQALCAEGGRGLTRTSHLETANGCPEMQSATREPSWTAKPAGPRLRQPAGLIGPSWAARAGVANLRCLKPKCRHTATAPPSQTSGLPSPPEQPHERPIGSPPTMGGLGALRAVVGDQRLG